MKKFIALFTFVLASCSAATIDIMPVSGFDAEKFSGKWYEIARMDNDIAVGNELSDVTMTYVNESRGRFSVVRKGYDEKEGIFEEIAGKGKFAKDKTTGHLSISFRGPLYRDYIIFEVDKANYLSAYVSGGTDDTLWLLSRQPQINNVRKQDFIKTAKALGYDTEALIWADHSRAK